MNAGEAGIAAYFSLRLLNAPMLRLMLVVLTCAP